MRLADFLIHLLIAHGDSLKRLAALMGEEILTELLENTPEDVLRDVGLSSERKRLFNTTNQPQSSPIPISWSKKPPLPPSPYQEIEGAVTEMRLPAVLEFYIWSYPFYRIFIESDIDLNSRFNYPITPDTLKLVEDAVDYSQEWAKKLPLPSALSQQACQVVKNPWLKFRFDVLKDLGKRPLKALSSEP